MYKQFDIPVLTDDDNAIAESQTPAAGGVQSLTLDGANVSGGVATTTNRTAQPVRLTCAGNETSRTFTVTFKDADGIEQTGTIDGVNATTADSSFYAVSVSAITVDDDTAGAVEFGWVAAAGMSTATIPMNHKKNPFSTSLFFDLTAGTMTVSAQHSEYDIQGTYTNSFSTDAKWRNTTGLTGVTSDDETNIAFPVTAVRFIQTAGSATGTAKFTIIQSDTA